MVKDGILFRGKVVNLYKEQSNPQTRFRCMNVVITVI